MTNADWVNSNASFSASSDFFNIPNVSGHTKEDGTTATFKVALKDDSHFPPTPGDPTVHYSVNNKALDFDGVNDYVATASNISALNITGDITVQTWVYISALQNDWVRLIGKGDAGYRTYGLWLHPTGRLMFQQYGGSGNEVYSNTNLSTIIYGNVLNSTGSIIPMIWKSINSN